MASSSQDMVYVASLHDKTFRTYTKTGDAFRLETEEVLTFDLWKLQRKRVLQSLSYNACSATVTLSYILNYKDAEYEPYLSKNKTQNANSEYKQIDVFDADNTYKTDESGNLIYPPRGLKTKKDYIIDLDETTKKNTRFEARINSRVDGRGIYAEGQHIALYKDESFTETYQEPEMVDFKDIERNVIVTYIHGGTCRGFVLGHYSDKDTFTTVGPNTYEKYYDGIYIDVVCCVVPRGGMNMIKILKEAWGEKNVTLKSLTPVLTFYPKVGFSFGTCKNPLDKNVNAEIVELLNKATEQRSANLSEEAKRTDPGFVGRYSSDPKHLSKSRKKAFKLLFGNNLADDQNNKLELWAKKGKERCEFFMPDKEKGETFAKLTDDQLNQSYMKCGDNGFKMAYCRNEDVVHPRTVRVAPKEPLKPRTEKKSKPKEKARSPPRTEKKPKKPRQSPKLLPAEEFVEVGPAYERVKREFEREVRARFSESTPFHVILDSVPDPMALQIWHVFHREEPFRVNDVVFAPFGGRYYEGKIARERGDRTDKYRVHWKGYPKNKDSFFDFSDLQRQMPS
jgi:hypothetical protein